MWFWTLSNQTSQTKSNWIEYWGRPRPRTGSHPTAKRIVQFFCCCCSSIPNFVQLWIQFHWNSALTLQYFTSRCFCQWLWQSFKLCQSLHIASLFMFVVCSISKKMKDTTALLHFEFSFRVDKSRHTFPTVLQLNFLRFLFHSVQGCWVATEASFSILYILPQSSSICTKIGNFSLTGNFKFHFWVHVTYICVDSPYTKISLWTEKNTRLKIY